MGLLDIFRAPQPIRDPEALAEFIDRNAAFLAQKGIYEYSRARAGHYAKVLFAEPAFIAAIEQSRWTAYPLCLAMIVEVVEGVLRAQGDDRRRVLDTLIELSLSVFDRYPVPAALGDQAWSDARRELARRSRSHWHPCREMGEGRAGAFRPELFRPDADPRKAPRQGFPRHQELSQGNAV